MARRAFTYNRFISGLSDFEKEGVQATFGVASGSYFFGRNLDVRTDPRAISLLPRTVKSSGSVVTDLTKWIEPVSTTEETFFYGDTGKVTKRTSAGVYTALFTVPDSHGNGMSYFGDDDYLYMTQDSTIARYGPLSNNPQFTPDFLGAQGGVPLNTNSMLLVAASTQYASRADTASLSITGNLAIEAWVKPTTLPAAGSSQVMVSKWTENGNLRSYRFEIRGVSGYFGNGGDGALVVNSATTEAPIDSACTGVIGTTSLSATNASFVAGQIIMIHQSQGVGAGSWQRNVIQSYTAGTITLQTPLNTDYISGSQVRVLKQYTNVTISDVYSAKAWDGTSGGIIAFIYSGTYTNSGTISSGLLGPGGGYSIANQGYRGATTASGQGEGTLGLRNNISTNADGSGGSGGGGGTSTTRSGGGGGGNGAQGSNGVSSGFGVGGIAAGSADLTTIVFGGGGGRGGGSSGEGGFGGGIIFISGPTFDATAGLLKAYGSDGQVGNSPEGSGGGGGAGGSILIKCQVGTLGTNRLLAQGGNGGTTGNGLGNGGAGAPGRIHLDYLTSFTGTTSPTLNAIQDDTLVSTATTQLRLGVSSNGTANEFLTQVANLSTGMWQQVAVSWTALSSTAIFYLNGVSLGSDVGTITSISDNASAFNVGRYLDGASATAGLLNAGIDEVRVWSTTRSANDIVTNLNTQIAANSAGLAAYYQLNGDVNDATANANNLTASGSPTFPTDVPFLSPSTRLDIDQTQSATGQVYTTPIAISENSTNRLTFTPEFDPQKSIAFTIVAKGTGDWTITIHNQFNQTIATSTVTNANLSTGVFEFTFSPAWRPVLGNTYHAHVTSTVADGTLTTQVASDLETAAYTTYYQFLVTDTDFHPILPMLNFLAFGNGRYVATWVIGDYEPNVLTLAPKYRIRCFGYWREFLVIGTWVGATVTAHDQGRLYFWDGISDTFNFFIDVPEGAINAVLGTKGRLFVWAGYQGDLLVYTGGDSAEKMKRIPYVSPTVYVETFPGAVVMWKTLIRFGVAGNTNSNEINQAVYTYGRTNQNYSEALTCDYTISTGNYLSTVKIGAVGVTDDTLLIGWQDGTGFGIDEVDSSNAPYTSGQMVFMIEDAGIVSKYKSLLTMVADYSTLQTGEGVAMSYAVERSSMFTPDPTTVTPVTSITTFPTGGDRFREIQFAVTLTSTSGTSPSVYEIAAEYDDLTAEKIGGVS